MIGYVYTGRDGSAGYRVHAPSLCASPQAVTDDQRYHLV